MPSLSRRLMGLFFTETTILPPLLTARPWAFSEIAGPAAVLGLGIELPWMLPWSGFHVLTDTPLRKILMSVELVKGLAASTLMVLLRTLNVMEFDEFWATST